MTRRVLVSALCLFPTFAFADGYTPEAARARMVLPEGFHAEVFASEPMIRQPLTVSFDERGRAWVIEYLQYPNPAGLKPVTVDQYLRTEYDRVPEPPPKGPKGVDRVVILEDTDGDGKADKKTVFVEGLNLASGLAVGHGGVFVGQAPYLLFYPDKNKDDKPDSDPEVLLKGFGLQDAHATVNSMQWGPDGWLYGAQGSTVTANINGIAFQQGIWRFEPRSKRFELFAEGGGNTWGLDFDRAGNAFGSSNGSFITFHMVQGGNYWKGFAKHGPLHNPNAFGYFDAIAYSGQKVGGHVTPGGIFYKADAYPEKFRNTFIGGNLLSNAVYWHELTAKGSTFSGKHGGTLLDSKDKWFRPIDLQVGPDGCVYVVDWYDKRASHLDPRDNWDKTNGRIYRIVYGERKKVEPFDLSKKSSEELVALRDSKNDWYAATARRILAERRDASVVAKLKSLLQQDHDEVLALRDFWALNACGGLDDSTALGLLEHPVPAVRRWTVRLLGDDAKMNGSLRASLLNLTANETDPLVRSQLAASCQRWSSMDALPILAELIRRDEDRNDPQIPLMLWWAVERQLRNDKGALFNAITEQEGKTFPIVGDVIPERLARACVSGATEEGFSTCSMLLLFAKSQVEKKAILAGMEKGLEGVRLTTVPEAFRPIPDIPGLFQELFGSADVTTMRLFARLGDASAFNDVLKLLRDAKTPVSERNSLAELVGQLARPNGLPVLLSMVEDDKEQAFFQNVLKALGGYKDLEVATRLVARYPKLPPASRDRVVTLLCSRPVWASVLLDAMAEKKISPKDVRPPQALQIVSLGNEVLTSRVQQIWGRLPGPGSPEKIKRIAEVRGFLPEGDKGVAVRGAPVFKENCAACHKLFGEGENIGPDLTGAERGNLDFLLTSLIDPSAMIRKEYAAQSVALKDGRVLTGLIVDETGQTLTLFDSNKQKTVIPRDQVEETKPSSVSLMPEGMLDKLREDQVRDLFKYLQSSGKPTN